MSGVTWAVLKILGKWPSANERLANLQIIGTKMSAHDLSRDVGTKSIGDDFCGIEFKILWTSSWVTDRRLLRHSPVWSLSAENGLIGNPASWLAMAVLMVIILSWKYSARILQKLRHSSGCLNVPEFFVFVCNKSLTVFHCCLESLAWSIRALKKLLRQFVMIRFVERHTRRYSLRVSSSPRCFQRFSKRLRWRLALIASGESQRFDFCPPCLNLVCNGATESRTSPTTDLNCSEYRSAVVSGIVNRAESLNSDLNLQMSIFLISRNEYSIVIGFVVTAGMIQVIRWWSDISPASWVRIMSTVVESSAVITRSRIFWFLVGAFTCCLKPNLSSKEANASSIDVWSRPVYCIVFLFWYKPHYHRDSKFWIRYLVRTPVVITDDIIKASFLSSSSSSPSSLSSSPSSSSS